MLVQLLLDKGARRARTVLPPQWEGRPCLPTSSPPSPLLVLDLSSRFGLLASSFLFHQTVKALSVVLALRKDGISYLINMASLSLGRLSVRSLLFQTCGN